MLYKKINATGRLFFVSDIHGELDTLLSGLKELNFNEDTDTLVCAGDLIDRGTNSYNTAKFFLENKVGCYHTVLGNHDVFSFENNTKQNGGLWFANGGQWAFIDMNQTERTLFGDWMKILPYAIEVKHEDTSYGVVHAAVPQEFKSWQDFVECLESGNEAIKQDCTWIREFAEYPNCSDFQKPLEGIDFTIHGHSVIREPLMVGNRLHIDTGLVYGKHLTITEVNKGEFTHHKFELKREG